MSGGYASLGASGPTPPDPSDLVHVALPSGAQFPVHREEVDYATDLARRYMEDNHFSNIADLQDVDRMLLMELLCFRWGVWLSRGTDYDGQTIDPDATEKSLKNHSAEVRQIKASLDITKRARDRAKGEDSVPAYIMNLLARAKEFGIYREDQLAKALELFNQLMALATLYKNCDELERQELHVEAEDVIEWILGTAIPQYLEIDAYFRAHQQRMWVRSI